jgi:murein DD-endopeptidase MepM/ murein hydrolase activator NlpD
MSRRLLLAVILGMIAAFSAYGLKAPMRQYVVSSGVGYRINPMGGGGESLHRGIDMVGPPGCEILAAGSGVIVEHWPAPGTRGGDGRVFKGHPVLGGMIVIDHGNGVWTMYGHMSRTYVHTGQRVTTGQVIGRQGATGDATGEHLHFEVIVSPLLFFDPPLGLSQRGEKELLR